MENGRPTENLHDATKGIAATEENEQDEVSSKGQSQALEVNDKRTENSFKAAHGLVIAFLTLLMSALPTKTPHMLLS